MEALPLRLLDEIECREMLSLTWGYVDGSLSRDQVEKIALNVIQQSGTDDDPDDLIENLLDRQLVFERGARIRSRFAEAVRLSARIRQWFPGRSWESAPHLVADFRLARRPRRYPKRDQDPRAFWNSLPAQLSHDARRAALWTALTQTSAGAVLSLARFQTEAAVRLLDAPTGDTATIVSAGTGSGKTLCFYLPALVEMGARVRSSEHWTMALAIYPRVELLKDQLSEALGLAGRLTAELSRNVVRPLRVGVLYGQTPRSTRDLSKAWMERAGWALQSNRGYFCPMVRCPVCGSDVHWSETDVAARSERLTCVTGHVIDNLVLTRESLQAQAPDLLFTTTEMINRRLTDPAMRSVMGVDRSPGQRPFFVLLDEAHTYSGASGAQAALTLGRWRHAMGTGVVRWVGLSATLGDPEAFFSALTGVPRDSVELIAPAVEDMEEEGAEYQVALRGDPASQTSLLSTTIQEVMLLGRIADTSAHVSQRVVGRKAFVFTDDLDVVNRLYHNIADAEAYRFQGNRARPDPTRQPLAALRADGGDARERDAEGQRWWAPEKIGHRLDDRLRLDRTTSQDSGVDPAATVVVATSTLEVGFNDLEVGFVLQHKAPKDMAGFLQRKGRAGRQRGMRSWMVTILSDYGRDRTCYAAFEQLFDPELPASTLPVDNLYLMKIHATFALIEWLYAECTARGEPTSIWPVLARPSQPQGFRKRVLGVLGELLRPGSAGEAVRGRLEAHLRGALRIDPSRSAERLEAILWEPPRSVLLEVVPTLMRRLWSNWNLAFPEPNGVGQEAYEPNQPLPEFLPRTLFSELTLPDVRILADRADQATLPIVQALNHLVPGRVTRRFAPRDARLSHWIPCDWTAAPCVLDIETFTTDAETFRAGTPAVTVFRPREVKLAVAPVEVLPTSNATWIWCSEISPGVAPRELPFPTLGPWAGVIRRLEAHTYRQRAPIYARRFASEGEAAIRIKRGGGVMEHRVPFALAKAGQSVAIGLEQAVDGIYVEFELPHSDALAAAPLPADVLATCRGAYFRHLVSGDKELAALGNVFQLDWLAQIFLAACAEQAGLRGLLLADCAERIGAFELKAALRTLLPSANVGSALGEGGEGSDDEQDEADQADDGSSRSEQKLVRQLRTLVDNDGVGRRLRELASRLTAVTDARDWGGWLREVMHETLAQASLEAAGAALPRTSVIDNLLCDPVIGSTEDTVGVWLSEDTLGGAGVVEELSTLIEKEPRRWPRAIEAALAPTDLEQAAVALRVLCDLIMDDESVAALVLECCRQVSHAERYASLMRLMSVLAQRGHTVGRAFAASANHRLLRPNVSREFFALLCNLDDFRADLQRKLGVLIDLRVFCRVAEADLRFGERLRHEFGRLRGVPLADGEAAQLLSGVLWPQPAELRGGRPPAYHPFRRVGTIDPGLVRALMLRDVSIRVELSDANWIAKVRQPLAEYGVARLATAKENLLELRNALLTLTTERLEVGWLHLFAAVERIEMNGSEYVAVLMLREWS